MNVKKRLMKNVSALLMLKGFEYLLPMLTVPYLVRILGNANFGVMSYAIAVSYFFVVITNYGFDLTATRQISIDKDNKEKVSKIFSAVISLKIIIMVVCFMAMVGATMMIPKLKEDSIVYYIAFFTVIGNALFPLWLFQGLEKMEYITGINMVSKFMTTGLIFVLVHNQGDYIIALFLQAIPLIVCALFSFIVIWKKKLCFYELPSMQELIHSLRDGWHIFTSSLMSFVLSSSGVIVLGFFGSKELVGIYSAIDKLSKTVIGLFAPITQALFPYNSELFSKSYEEGKKGVIKYGSLVLILAIITSGFMMVFSKEILVLFYGESYQVYVFAIQLYSIWQFGSILNNIIGIQYLVASGESALYSKSFLVSCMATLLLFFILTPKLSMYGIIYSINIGELVLTACMCIFIVIKEKKIYRVNRPN